MNLLFDYLIDLLLQIYTEKKKQRFFILGINFENYYEIAFY